MGANVSQTFSKVYVCTRKFQEIFTDPKREKELFPFFFCVCQRVAQDKVDARFPV
jgi:hypothetical protein